MKIKESGINKKEGTLYVTFTYNKVDYMITWRPTNKDDGVVFDVGILPVKGETDGPYKRVDGKKGKDETGTRTNEKSRS
jgi:hypothetical protein